MGRRSITGGVRAKGRNRIQFDFEFEGARYRPKVPHIPTEANLRRARQLPTRREHRRAFPSVCRLKNLQSRRQGPLPDNQHCSRSS
jgi:hypothetical protein